MDRYGVVYEDGDTEDMTWREVLRHSPTWLQGGWLRSCTAMLLDSRAQHTGSTTGYLMSQNVSTGTSHSITLRAWWRMPAQAVAGCTSARQHNRSTFAALSHYRTAHLEFFCC
jgi:uncharacterized membrane protein AbrB (regulator of aidB expression)